jgi:hypothetical protein
MCKAMVKVTWKVVNVVINGIMIIGLTLGYSGISVYI